MVGRGGRFSKSDRLAPAYLDVGFSGALWYMAWIMN